MCIAHILPDLAHILCDHKHFTTASICNRLRISVSIFFSASPFPLRARARAICTHMAWLWMRIIIHAHRQIFYLFIRIRYLATYYYTMKNSFSVLYIVCMCATGGRIGIHIFFFFSAVVLFSKENVLSVMKNQ